MEDIIGLVVTGCQRAKEVEANVLHGAAAMDLPDRCEEIACIFRAASYRLRSLQNDPSSLPLQLQNIASDGNGRENSRSFQLKRTRKDEAMKRTVEVATPLHDDGFTWRKYGQKEILNYQYPRGYYRCTHQRAYGCPAKKQVQRQNNNPDVYQVTYRGQHTCQIPTTRHHGTSHSTPSIDAVTPSVFDNNTSETEDHAMVADMVDAMFNTIDAAPNSIDSIFSNATN